MNEALNMAVERRGWSRSKLARLSGLDRSTVTNIISGKNCSMFAAYRIAQALGERVDDIFLPKYVLNQKQERLNKSEVLP
jgi:DNA-binding XRE family transcriptional regulator